MVGEGVLSECLTHPDVEKILVINRKSCGVTHPKLSEILHNDFFNLSPVADQVKRLQCMLFLSWGIFGRHERRGILFSDLYPHNEFC